MSTSHKKYYIARIVTNFTCLNVENMKKYFDYYKMSDYPINADVILKMILNNDIRHSKILIQEANDE